MLRETEWLADLAVIPPEAAPPTEMTPPHPLATGSYGREAEQWIRDQLKMELRWWQALSLRRQLEHDADGQLVWRTVLESTPRRSGKSRLMMARAGWRLDHAEQLGEEQLVMHTGKDLPICKEIHRRAWPWAERRGWNVKRLNGNEEIETSNGSRWLVRGRNSVYGYDTTFGMVDEGWAVEPSVVDDGLEPSLLERKQPQLLMTSTAHRRATSLMRRRMTGGLDGADGTTLVLLWAAPEDADLADEAAWRAASPHWSPDRRALIVSTLARAQAGEHDADPDDPDPLSSFQSQYLNRWPRSGRASLSEPGDLVVSALEWHAAGGVPVPHPAVVAVESWPGQPGAAVARAQRLPDGRVAVSAAVHGDVAAAAAAALASGATTVLAGKSLAGEVPGSTATGGTTRQAVTDLRRLLDDGVLCHDGGVALGEQVLVVRADRGADGLRIRSSHRADAVKAAAWAAVAARVATDQSAVF